MTGERVVDEVRRVLGDPAALADRLGAGPGEELPEAFAGDAGDAGDDLETLEEGRPPDLLAEAARHARARVVADGLDGLAKLADGRDDDLDDAELLGLEAIVLLEGRPAILIQGGDFVRPPHDWARRLEARRAGIREAIARSGRVEVSGHLDYEWVGTAALIGPGTVMTNRHVALEFCSRSGSAWTFRPGMTSRVDFLREEGRGASLEFEVTSVIGIHEERDLALLAVEGASTDGRPLPDPLPVAASEPEAVHGRDVYLVGYPAWDGRRGEPGPLRRIFMDLYDVKRLQPGQAVAYSSTFSALEHDCSTLGGNSGSPLLDLETNRVIGLHFGGRRGVGNYAVPLWMLTADPLLAGDLNFV